MGREAWWATVYGVAKVSDRTEQQQQQIHGVTCVNGPPFPNIFADAGTKALASTDWFLKELLKTFKKFGVEYHFNLGELSFPGEMRWNTNKSESKDSLHDWMVISVRPEFLSVSIQTAVFNTVRFATIV